MEKEKKETPSLFLCSPVRQLLRGGAWKGDGKNCYNLTFFHDQLGRLFVDGTAVGPHADVRSGIGRLHVGDVQEPVEVSRPRQREFSVLLIPHDDVGSRHVALRCTHEGDVRSCWDSYHRWLMHRHLDPGSVRFSHGDVGLSATGSVPTSCMANVSSLITVFYVSNY